MILRVRPFRYQYLIGNSIGYRYQLGHLPSDKRRREDHILIDAVFRDERTNGGHFSVVDFVVEFSHSRRRRSRGRWRNGRGYTILGIDRISGKISDPKVRDYNEQVSYREHLVGGDRQLWSGWGMNSAGGSHRSDESKSSLHREKFRLVVDCNLNHKFTVSLSLSSHKFKPLVVARLGPGTWAGKEMKDEIIERRFKEK